ncbi:MAG: hypothetical protein LBG29_00490 [Synergistaceae bacterium]|jgi:hypothetical protein|nr:hypothetical protein [Synergistaceae bacterium]
MDNEFAPQIRYVVQAYIDAKDDRGRTLNGTIVSLVTRRAVTHTSVIFGHMETDKSMNWRDLLPLHEEARKDASRDPLFLHYEDGLYKFLEMSLLLTNVAKNLNTKPAEQAISRFCLDDLKLKAVCFVSFSTASDDDIAIFSKDEPPSDQSGGDAAQEGEPEAGTAAPDTGNEQSGENRELFVRCDPILDPVGGIAMNTLLVGDSIYGKLASDSIIYKLLAKNDPRFDGIVTAKVSGIAMNDLGTATVSLTLSDGVAGIMKLSGKVRVKAAMETEYERQGANRMGFFPSGMSPLAMPPEFMFAAAGVIVVIAALVVLYYIFTF